jgi:ribosomal protein L16 Arg81 hydroxylase
MVLCQTTSASHSLSGDWKRWVAENKMLGLDNRRLVEILVENGVDEQTAVIEVDSVAAHPYFQAGQRAVQKLRKIESLLDVYANLGHVRSAAKFQTVERRSNVPREEFRDKYYAANRPVILLDLMKEWTARTLWNPEYLRAKCGNEMVEVMTGRNLDPRYEINAELHKTVMPFGQYIDQITQNGAGNDWYLVANNNVLHRQGMRHLYKDIVVFPEYLDDNNLDGGVFFWFGPAGTVTPLHHDVMNVLMAQVCGRKRVTLIPSEQIHRVYNDIGVYSQVDCEKPDYQKFPEFRNVQMQRFVLKPGEVLFIPVGWWHHVRSLDVSITVSFTNFAFPNHYHWNHPEGGAQ